MSDYETEKPRGRISAYMYYVKSCWKMHHKNNPEVKVNFKEFAKQCGQQWREMSPKEKRRFQRLSDKDKTRYDAEMADYRAAEEERKKLIPKRPLTAYLWFCTEQRPVVRESMPDAPITEVAKELGKRWKQCSPEEKEKYVKMATKDKQRYEKQMKVYNKKKEARQNDEENEDYYNYDKRDKYKKARSTSRLNPSESSEGDHSSESDY
ncbi:hypothetical protein RDWZM_004917 [Blomia tropicalis]|uniref:HMG box domain-containing protein n=1 Tax=Blomia tropicalis TaxID=40697 RepID=A0A9Q0M4S6_BLOTA|nr:High mobility group [Blomia tropicalis]KAJ6219105.1 hypothetical protein RDWZM_004917 [Blomia tropicalis]